MSYLIDDVIEKEMDIKTYSNLLVDKVKKISDKNSIFFIQYNVLSNHVDIRFCGESISIPLKDFDNFADVIIEVQNIESEK